MKKAVSMLVVLVLGVLMITGCGEKKATGSVTDENVTVSVKYPEEGYKYTPNPNSNVKSASLIKDGGDFKIIVRIDTVTISDYFGGNFDSLKARRAEKYEISDVTINKVTGFGYYKTSTDDYIISLPVDEKRTVDIKIEPLEKFKEVTGQNIYERDEIKEIINSITISK